MEDARQRQRTNEGGKAMERQTVRISVGEKEERR
jgi:hypothetical protein